jgi:hypothetical protein
VRLFGYLTFEWASEGTISVFNGSDPKVYPNPANTSLTFGIEGLQPYEIYSINGTRILEGETTGTVDISFLKSGLYLAQIGNESVKFVKE